MIDILLPLTIAGTDGCIKKMREENDNVYDCLDGNVKIVTYRNRGAFLGIGEKNPVLVLFLSVLLTAIISVIFVLTLTKKGTKTLRAGLGLLLGGAFSNAYDRAKKGYVTDYIIFSKAPGKIKNIVFNISDFAIIVGTLISALQ